MNDGKAYVCYTELPRNIGPGQSTEWVLLGREEGEVCIHHPVCTLKYAGTRKRRRVARGDCSRSIGDKLDAWIHNGYW